MVTAEQIDLARAAPFRLGALVVEPALRQVMCADGSDRETIEPRVMQVLVVLAMANGGIVTRDELVRQCWEGRIVGNDSINRVIARLRKLTEGDTSGSCRIETITKVGYRLIGDIMLIEAPKRPPLQTVPAPSTQGIANHGGLDENAWAALVSDVRNLITTDQIASREAPVETVEPAQAPEPAQPATAPASSTPILAVLPFDNLSGDTELAYFSDGVSEDILHSTARAKGLKVIGKASSFQFRGADKTIRQIVAELGATHMLDGSVRRAGDRIRVTAQLVDTDTQLTLWSERYDRAMTDIFSLQDDIATAIATTLDTWLTPAHSPAAVDPEAYDHYLRARAAYSQDNSHAEQLRCIALLEHTVARAPDFALAWGMLAMFHGLALPRTSDDGGWANRAAAQAEAARALALDPACGPALMALAMLKPAFAEYAEKRRLAERAYTLTNGDATIAVFYAAALANTGRVREACAVLDVLVAREPLAPMFGAIRAWFYRAIAAGPEATKMAADTATAFPNSDYALLVAGLIAIYDHDSDRAAQILVSAPGRLSALQSASDYYTNARRLTAAERSDFVRNELQATHPVCYLVSVGLAAHVGEADIAIEHLCNAIIAGQPIAYDRHDEGRGVARANIAAALFGVPMEALRRHPRFAEACVRLGLHAYWQAHNDWPDCTAEVAPWYDFRSECERVALLIG